ncbi:hypothetical protein ACOME3_002009 [Neoechinorhynchus agilis]
MFFNNNNHGYEDAVELQERRSLLINRPSKKYGALCHAEIFPDCTFVKHKINSTDTIQGIALKYNTSMQHIKRANQIVTDMDFMAKTELLVPVETRQQNQYNV